MKIVDVLEIAYLRLGLDNTTGFSDVVKSLSRPEVKKLIKCINMAICEIATNYIFAQKAEDVIISDGKLFYRNLSERVLEIKKITCQNFNIDFVNFGDRIELDYNGKAKVIYRYIPREYNIEDEIDLIPKVTADIIALGACAEYCLLIGRYDDCLLFDKKYKDLLKIATKQTKNVMVKARKW